VFSGDGVCAICWNDIYGLEETVPLNKLSKFEKPPMPSVAISKSGRGGRPTVVVADNYEYIVGYSFSPAEGFQEIYRKHLTIGQIDMTSPALLRDGHAVIGANSSDQNWLMFGAPSHVANWTEIVVPHTGATPTVNGAGNILVVNRAGGLTVVGVTPGRSILAQVRLEAQSIAPAAASHNHIFVSAADRLITLYAQTLQVYVQIFLSRGGLSSPAIDDCGRVYDLAGDTLFIFPAPPGSPSPRRWCGAGRIIITPDGGILDRNVLNPSNGGVILR
jgi:hypothetical protein